MDDVIIVGSLDKKELEKSIQDLVDYVGNKTNVMASKFTEGLDKMKLAMKDFAITQKVSVDTMQEAWRKMSQSFDAMVAAQSASSRGGSSGGGSSAQPNTIGELKEQIRLQQQKVDEQIRGTAEAQKEVNIHRELQRQLKQETKDEIKRNTERAKYDLKNAMSLPQNDIAQATKRLQELQSVLSKWKGRGFLDVSEINRLENAIDRTKKKIEQLRNTKPKSLRDVLGMDENSVDAVAKKMAALKRVGVDPKDTAQVRQLGNEYQRLSRLQATLLGKNIQLTHSNNYLAQSFGYIRNRVVYALTLGAISNFTKQVLEIRGQYELLERSLGVLVGSFERGSEIFNELNQMAIKSPFTLIELGTAAKQLTAYNFAADEVVDTTRRLADISAALGVSMERLTYNLGQIKAQGVLNARDARDFANAGLAIVPMLAKMYTEQKTFGDEMVTTAQVYDMMSKKMVTYSDVLKVLYQVTDEGGKFFDFQAKQADTLRVQMANLTLAYNNMLNEIGSENQGILVGMVSGLKTLLKNWRDVSRIVLTLITTFGTYKAVASIVTALNSRMFVGRVIVSIMQYIKGIKAATGAMATFNAVTKMNPIGLLVSALAAAVGYFVLFDNSVSEASEIVEQFGENGAKSLKKIDTLQKVLNGTSETSSVYKKTLEELSTITSEYGVQLDKENAKRSDINKAIEQTIQLIKEESAERQRANQLEQARSTYESETETARKELQETLAKSSNISGGGVDATYLNAIKENSEAIASIVDEVVTNNIHLIVNKSGEELEKGINDLYGIINTRLKKVGISGGDIQQILSGLLSSTSAVEKFAISIANANEKLERRGKIIERNKQVADEATQATMTFTQKVDANARALRNNTSDAISLYNQIYDIVKIAKENHTIKFDLELVAQQPPKWMQNIDLPELQRLAARFTAIAQSGGHAKGYTRETTYEQGLLYASAAREKQYKQERQALEDRNKHDKKTKSSGGGSKKDPFAEALKDEIELINNIQKRYNEYRKMSVSTQEAVTKAADEYNNTLMRINATLSKYGVQTKSAQELANMDLRGVRDYYKSLLDVAKGANNAKGIESLEKSIANINVEITKADYKKLTDGLNNELGKLKDEYELAIELDANPELGNMFADMFGITPEMLSEMPHTVGQLVDKYQDEIDKQLKDKFNTPFDILKTDIDKWAKYTGVNPESDLIKTLSSTQNKAREMVKKTFLDTQKMIDDYISEYGDQQQQIEKIEKEKNNALIELNSIYNTEALRQTKEYINAKEAIENAARIKSAKASFDALKKTTDYERFFNAIDTLTSKDALAIKAKIKQGIIQAFKDGGLTVSEFRREIKALESQFDKLTESSSLWTNYLSGGFDKLIQKAKETGQEIEAIGESISIKGTIDDKDKNFLQSMGSIFSNGNGGNMDFTSLMNKFGGNMKGLGDAVSQAGQGMQQGAGGFASAVAVIDTIIKNVHQTVQAIGSVIDELDSVRNEDSKISNAYWEGFKKFDNYAMSGWENLKSGNVAGAIGDTANSIISVFNTFSNAKNEKINKQIKESERTVKDLENAYKNLSAAIDDSLGNAEIKARRAAVENKKLQLVELERQLQLEQSRSSKRRDEDRIKELQGQITDAKNEIKDLTAEITSTLLGNDIKSAAEDFVSTWVAAWRQGEDTMDALNKKFDGMIDNMIAKSVASYLVSKRLQRIFDAVDEVTSEKSEGGAEITMNELKRIKSLIGDKSIAEQINQDLTNLYGALDIAYGVDSETNKNLSALQQGIQGITEDTAGAIEAYMNGMSQQVYLQSGVLTQIRDTILGFELDVQLGVSSQMLMQLQQSYQVQQSIEQVLQNVLNPSGRAFVVELAS